MNKKIISLLIFLFLGSLIFIQSCNESPIVSSYNENVSFQNDPNFTERLISYKFGSFGQGLPVKCLGQTPSNNETRITLWGNNGEFEVGWIEFDQFIPNADSSFDAGRIHVIYHFNFEANMFPWYVTQIHFHIGDKLSDIPHDGNGIKLENCGYIYKSLDTIKTGIHSFWYNLPDDNDNDGYYIFAHAHGCHYGGIEGFNMYLPNTPVSFNLQRDYWNAYFKIRFTDEDIGFLSNYDPPGNDPPGTFYGFCIDKDHLAQIGNQFGILYSSYETLPISIIGNNGIEFPDNFDLANYIVNNYSHGSSVTLCSNSGSQVFPFGYIQPISGNPQEQVEVADIQNALWSIFDDLPPSQSWMNPRNPARVWGIIYDAICNGENFVPECDQKIVTLIVPVDYPNYPQWNGMQFMIFYPTINQLQIPCVTHCGSISGDGKYGATYPGSSSSYTYFRWDLQCSGMP